MAVTRLTAASKRMRPWCWTIGAWLTSLPLALALPGLVGLSPWTLRGSATPLLAGVALLTAGLAAAWRRPGGPVPDIAAGACAGWVVLTMHTALHGTPYGFGGLVGDMARISAAATRYRTTLHSADGIVGTVPADYPPLFPWLIGRASALSGTPAWRLLGLSETLLMSAAIVCPYLLWRRLLPAGVALAVTLVSFTTYMEPEKPYEVLTLGLLLPWTLLTFARPTRGRLHWAPAGVIGGLQVVLYQGYLMFAALGIAAIIAVVWRARAERAYARHVAGVIAVALIVSSPYLLPYGSWALQHGLQMTDYYQDPGIALDPFPFLSLTPLGILTAIGVAGLLWHRRVSWWAAPLTLLTVGVYAYRFTAELGYVAGGGTQVFQYTSRVVTVTLAVSATLSLVAGVPALAERLSLSRPAGGGALVLGALAAAMGVTAWHAWLPGAPAGTTGSVALTGAFNEASQAFQQPLPDGAYPPGAPQTGRLAWFPIDPVVRDVDSVLGRHAAPRTLSDSEQLFAVRPWPGYLGVGANAAASTSEWFSRVAALRALSRVRSATAFADASAHTRFGPIDAFVLQQDGASWDWTATNGPATVRFTPAQFASPDFTVFRGLPDATVVAVRRDAG